MSHSDVRRVIARTLTTALARRFSNPVLYTAAQEGIPVLTCAGDRGVCSVCLEEIVEGDTFRLLPCSDTVNHSFHKICIDPWLTLHATCPTCRANVST